MNLIVADILTLKTRKKSITAEQLKALNALAEEYLAIPVNPITNKRHLQEGCSKNDYISLGTYWWPNPNKADGLPYIRRDGYVNPLGRNPDYFDRGRLDEMTSLVFALSTAYYYTGNLSYRNLATKHLDAWFVDNYTRMNPHLELAQQIPGICRGRDIGIIDTNSLVELADSALLLDYDHIDIMRDWYADYLAWLLTSENGIGESRKLNNHGLWYDVQVMAFADFIGRPELIEKASLSIQSRLKFQVAADGSFPDELQRTRSYMYSLFALRAAVYGAVIAEKYNCGFWNLVLKCGSFQNCFAYILPFATGESKWQYEQIDPVPPQNAALCFRFASLVYNHPDYNAAAKVIYNNPKYINAMLLRYPL